MLLKSLITKDESNNITTLKAQKLYKELMVEANA